MKFGRYLHREGLAWPAGLLDEWDDWLYEQTVQGTWNLLIDQNDRDLVFCPAHILEKAEERMKV